MIWTVAGRQEYQPGRTERKGEKTTRKQAGGSHERDRAGDHENLPPGLVPNPVPVPNPGLALLCPNPNPLPNDIAAQMFRPAYGVIRSKYIRSRVKGELVEATKRKLVDERKRN